MKFPVQFVISRDSQKVEAKVKVLCIGGLTIDEIFCISNIPKIDEATTIQEHYISFGGRGAVVATTLRLLGVSVDLITAVGKDFQASGYKNFLGEVGVGMEGLIFSNEDSCFRTFIFVDRQGNTTTFFQPRNLKFGKPTETHRKIIEESHIVYFAINDLEFNFNCIDIAFSKNKTIIHNLSTEIIFNMNYLQKAIKISTVLLMNEVEAQRLCKVLDIKTVARLFELSSRLEAIVVTLAEKGSQLCERGKEVVHIPAYPVSQIGDPIGLGDSYAAGFMFALMQGLTYIEAANLGAKVASTKAQNKGSHISQENRNKILQELKRI